MAVPNIGRIVLLNAKRLIRIIVGIARPLLVSMVVLLILVIVKLSVRLAELIRIVMLLLKPANMVAPLRTLAVNARNVKETQIVMLRL